MRNNAGPSGIWLSLFPGSENTRADALQELGDVSSFACSARKINRKTGRASLLSQSRQQSNVKGIYCHGLGMADWSGQQYFPH